MCEQHVVRLCERTLHAQLVHRTQRVRDLAADAQRILDTGAVPQEVAVLLALVLGSQHAVGDIHGRSEDQYLVRAERNTVALRERDTLGPRGRSVRVIRSVRVNHRSLRAGTEWMLRRNLGQCLLCGESRVGQRQRVAALNRPMELVSAEALLGEMEHLLARTQIVVVEMLAGL